MVLLRERVDDLASYLELWAARAASDRATSRTAANMALERINVIVDQLAALGVRLVSEIRTFESEQRP